MLLAALLLSLSACPSFWETAASREGECRPREARCGPFVTADDVSDDAEENGPTPPSGAPPDGACSDGTRASIQRYDIGIDLRSGETSSCLWLDASTKGSRWVSVESAIPVQRLTWNGVPTDGCFDEGILNVRVDDASRTRPGRMCSSFTMPEQHPASDFGFTRTQDRHGNEFTYLRSWVEQCPVLGPCNPDPAQLVELRFQITHEAEQVVLCPGALTTQGTKTRCTLDTVRAPTYSGLFLAANPGWRRTSHTLSSDIRLHLHEVPGAGVLETLDLARLDDFSSWITALLGALPYGDDLRVATAPMNWMGYEHPATILLNERIREFPPEYEDMAMHTLLHELVHQWAGNRTTLRHAQDFVWKEAIADYLVYVYEDEHMPPSTAKATLRTWDRLATFTPFYPVPEDDPPIPLETTASSAYGTGSMILLLQLEDLLDRATILEAIRLFLASPGARSVSDLKDALQTASGADLQRYFEAWIHGTGAPDWPFMRTQITQGATGPTLRIEQESLSGQAYPCVVEVALETTTGPLVVSGVFALDQPDTVLEIPLTLDGSVTAIQVDPRHRLVNLPFPPAPSAASPWHHHVVALHP
ncbi:M1 family aminopeptidase [Chondromyces crocatus]|uniref:Peptidase M1 membrane alanine aminopeptidase domain-containing protein n=1 Tax=Chondromyces crocatus TaxID=52 RepID=A0A0K1EFA2_CHOCO|nr:M1 family aminopeptidase [Chondromyces crocatus]AKT39372.1 uncharacterized protein CMC5_035190 [Chondromyces crocatus]